jgi:hypothetical protein
MSQNAAARHRLDRRLDALLAVIQANRDSKFMAMLKARAGIIDEVDKSVLLPLLYWHLVKNP